MKVKIEPEVQRKIFRNKRADNKPCDRIRNEI